MPITFRFLREHRLVIARHEGTTDDGEFLDAYNRVFHHPQYSTDMNILIDLRDAQSGNRGIEELKRIAKLPAQYRSNQTTPGKIAILAPSDIAFGISRIFEAYSSDEPVEVMIRRSVDEILDFLDLTADDLGEC